jgi:preprotein translocase subunit SecD
MSRSWYLRGFLFLALIVGAGLVLSHRKIQPGLDIQGGLRLVFEIDLDRLLPMIPGADAGEVDRDAVRERAIATAIERIESSMGPFRCGDEKVFREGDRIVVELPGLSPNEEDRTRALIYRLTSEMPALRFAIVDDDSEFMRKLAASLPDGGAIEVVTEKRCVQDGGLPCPHLRGR